MATTSFATDDPVRRWLKISRSRTSPMAGASTNTDTNRAGRIDQPHRFLGLEEHGRRHVGLGAEGEVEDAGRLVGEDEPERDRARRRCRAASPGGRPGGRPHRSTPPAAWAMARAGVSRRRLGSGSDHSSASAGQQSHGVSGRRHGHELTALDLHEDGALVARVDVAGSSCVYGSCATVQSIGCDQPAGVEGRHGVGGGGDLVAVELGPGGEQAVEGERGVDPTDHRQLVRLVAPACPSTRGSRPWPSPRCPPRRAGTARLTKSPSKRSPASATKAGCSVLGWYRTTSSIPWRGQLLREGLHAVESPCRSR